MEGAPAGFDERVLAAYLEPFKAALAELSEQIIALKMAADPRVATAEFMSMREALDRAGADHAAMHDNRVAAAEREFQLDAILTDLWKRKLTRDAATNRIKAELGLSYRDALAEVDGFLWD
jgi:hypothetical protein